MTDPLGDLSDIVHQRGRLAIMAALAEAGTLDFVNLRRVTGMTDGNLSRHLQVLADVGYVAIDKELAGRRPRTTVRVTTEGTAAFQAELALLQALVERFRPAVAGEGPRQKRSHPALPEPEF